MIQTDQREEAKISYLPILLLGFILLLCFFENINHLFKRQIKVLKLFLFIFIVKLFIDLITFNGNFNSTIILALQTASIPFFILYFYSLFRIYDLSFLLCKLSFGMLVGLSVIYILLFLNKNAALTATIENFTSMNVGYFPMFVLPCVMIGKQNNVLKLVAILIVVVVIFSGMKRGGLIALSLGLLTYFTIKYIFVEKSNNKIIAIVAVSIIMAIFFFIFMQFDSISGGVMSGRLEGIADDEGSGRMPIYLYTISMIENSDTLKFLFGHGHLAVIKDSILGFSAHNDFLEFFYDYGLFMFLLYVVFHISLIVYTLKLIRIKSYLAPAMGMSYMIFITLTMVSHVFFYSYFLFLMITWGSIWGIIEREISDSK